MNALGRPLVPAFLGMAGIVGMLLSEGWGDVACFVLAAVPLLYGGGHALAQRRAAKARARRQ